MKNKASHQIEEIAHANDIHKHFHFKFNNLGEIVAEGKEIGGFYFNTNFDSIRNIKRRVCLMGRMEICYNE